MSRLQIVYFRLKKLKGKWNVFPQLLVIAFLLMSGIFHVIFSRDTGPAWLTRIPTLSFSSFFFLLLKKINKNKKSFSLSFCLCLSFQITSDGNYITYNNDSPLQTHNTHQPFLDESHHQQGNSLIDLQPTDYLSVSSSSMDFFLLNTFKIETIFFFVFFSVSGILQINTPKNLLQQRHVN